MSAEANELLICPYDPVHRVAAKRFPYHLQKCRKQYSSIGWANCPFNARHEVPKEELDYHVSICPDKDIIRQDYEESKIVHAIIHLLKMFIGTIVI